MAVRGALIFTALGSTMCWGAYCERTGLSSGRKPDAELDVSVQESQPERT